MQGVGILLFVVWDRILSEAWIPVRRHHCHRAIGDISRAPHEGIYQGWNKTAVCNFMTKVLCVEMIFLSKYFSAY